MKLLISLLLWINFAGNPDLASIRKMYADVAKSETNAKEFTEKLSAVSNNDDKILVAYKAASILLDSKFEKKIILIKYSYDRACVCFCPARWWSWSIGSPAVPCAAKSSTMRDAVVPPTAPCCFAQLALGTLRT
jgi:hypothetical protein